MTTHFRPLAAAAALLLSAAAAAPASAQGMRPVPADFSSLIAARLDGVVTVAPVQDKTGDDGAGSGAAARSSSPPAASGTGFVIDPGGLVLAPAALLENSSRVTVTLADGSTLAGAVAGVDEKSGLAVVRTRGDRSLPALPWSDSQGLSLGNWLIALGRPSGGTPTAAVGIVSAPPGEMIRASLHIGPANIGGPVLDGQGDVVGVATLTAGPSGAPRGAILSSERTRRIVSGLLAKQTAESRTPKRLGVMIQTLDPGLAAALGIEPGTGVLVAAVEDASPAAKAGVKPGDVIAGFAGTAIQSPRQLRALVTQAKPDETIDLTVYRDGRPKTLSVSLGAAQPRRRAQPPQARNETSGGPAAPARLGMRLLPMNAAIARQLGIDGVDNGVIVVGVESGAPAAKAGVRPGDVIVAVGGRPVEAATDVVSALAGARQAGKDRAALRIYRDGAFHDLSVTV